MKKGNIVFAVCVILLCVIGWIGVSAQAFSKAGMYNGYVKQADEWVEKGLYQRAIENYTLALEEKESEILYERIHTAYSLRYEEAPEETWEDYGDFLETALIAYPGNALFVDSYVDMCYIESDYENMYNCLLNAIANGYDSEDVQNMLIKAQYAFKLRRAEFENIRQSANDMYAVKRNEGWNVYSIEEGYMLFQEYDYISPVNEDEMFVVTGKDSRILDSEGMTYGIFDSLISEAGVFADDLIAVCIDGKYAYYNDLAEKQLGDYDMAGAFQDGIAAVKANGKWMLINAEGEAQGDVFEEIVLDSIGQYMVDDLMLAKAKGKYGIYNEEMELQCELACSAVDVLTEDGIIAFCQGDKWGFVNTEGEVIVKPAYDEARSFSNGIAAVKDADKWGFIDTKGNLVIDYQFADVGYMSANGCCPVRVDLPEEVVESIGTDEVVDEDSESGNSESEAIEDEPKEEWKILELEIGIRES